MPIKPLGTWKLRCRWKESGRTRNAPRWVEPTSTTRGVPATGGGVGNEQVIGREGMLLDFHLVGKEVGICGNGRRDQKGFGQGVQVLG
jgi:hypothetical protein